jgi:hypothetical protein
MAMLPPANKVLLARLLTLMRKGTRLSSLIILGLLHIARLNRRPSVSAAAAAAIVAVCAVADHADTNKMHAQNLAIVFAPCLLRPENDDLMYRSPPYSIPTQR